MSDETRLKRQREGREAQAARENEEHTCCFEKPIRFEGLWQIIQCSMCPSRIQYMVVR